MKIMKFGGASICSANNIQNTAEIIKKYSKENLTIVVSAIGKTTNNLENLLDAYFNQKQQEKQKIFEQIKIFHYQIVSDLKIEKNEIDKTFFYLQNIINQDITENYDKLYDKIISCGEILSTQILHKYLEKTGIDCKWIDIRNCIKTDSTFREGKINWALSQKLCKKIFSKQDKIYITQGFIASDLQNNTTTLGREGSDYTAAVLANILEAKEVVVWKDVDGIYSADPKKITNARKISKISYNEAIELTYYGAKIIHPKTLQPLKSKNTPLYVKSFMDIRKKGTKISNFKQNIKYPSIYIFKENQVLFSLTSKNLLTINEFDLIGIFNIFKQNNIKINLLQSSSISISICFDHKKEKLQEIINSLSNDFNILYNIDLEIITIRHYNKKAINQIVKNKTIIIEQKTRNTAQFVVV